MLRAVEQSANEHGGSASVAEIAAATGLHENTVRGHLARLHVDGHIRPKPTAPSGRGRPMLRWAAVAPEELHPYAGLAATLADALAESAPEASAIARRAGVAWGTALAAARSASDGPRGLVLEVMREQGFAPDEETEDEHGTVIALRRCPLLAAASGRSDVVCAVHEGMIEGIANADGPGASASLEPFALPGACLLHLRSPLQATAA